ncbi:phosphocholine cytidylyltransferase family protein [Vibrio pectenicida]|uniref:Phosphocholine cytidylyltransferase family protein n=1 Tax=Vibrio pectenicida TaxID=62763 RepID=A0A7Y3ZXI8_9VIBR|nr:phosphocholine cytidylyltransferase family protein [Vibrio pectenicida]NOH70738.1 phosphocholine cytidylyltransferase family protein [Vibrio pectenicida]
MKMIILAAGKGTRLAPLTDSKPKCMVEYNSKPIIDRIMKTAFSCNIDNIAIVNGYKRSVLEEHLKGTSVNFFTNERFDKSNMVSTLFCAKDFMDDDLIISYSDIVYRKEILDLLKNNNDDFCVVIDRQWKKLWLQRTDDPLSDVETLRVRGGNIIEIGKKTDSYDDIEGQYIGLLKISKKAIKEVVDFYESLDENEVYDGTDYKNMYMTSFIQKIIDNVMDVKPLYIDGGWVEIDSISDLNSIMVTV